MHPLHAPERREPPRMHASDADLTAARERLAARMGRRLPRTPEEEEAAERAANAAIDAMRPRYEHRQRAYDAYRAKARTRRPRLDRPAPPSSRQYSPAMATTAVRDERLVMGARVCLQLICALIGRAASRLITKAYLAKKLGCHVRTIQRYLSYAREFGYITTVAVFDATGRQIGQRIAITDKLRTYWQVAKSLVGLGQPAEAPNRTGSVQAGETETSSNKILRESEENQPHACKEDRTASARFSDRARPPSR